MALLYPQPPPGRRSPWLLYIGVLLFVVLAWLAGHSIYREWQGRLGQERSETLFQLVQDKTPPRPTETPGVSAWLHLALKRYGRTLSDPEKARLYGEIVDWQDRRSVPPSFAVLRDLLATPTALETTATPRLIPLSGGDEPGGALQFRAQRFAELDGHWLVVTRRKALDQGGATGEASDRFLARIGPHLLRLADHLGPALAERPLPAAPGPHPPRVVRIYGLSEDGTLVSIPLAELTGDPAARRQAALAEGREFRKLPQLPNFVSNEFFFQFDFNSPSRQVYYSGLYLDLGGQGVVATITVPFLDTASGLAGVLGTDIAFDVDWPAFARQLERPMVAEVVRLGPLPEDRWRPWSDIETALPRDAQPALVRAVAALARRERREGLFVAPWYVQEGVVESQGAVVALQAAADTWLVVLFPRTPANFPAVPLVMLGILAVLLIGGFELYRRRAEQAQDKAERELAEKQNLLSTMQVPLLVVDPNSDAVVFGNEAARRLGIEAGVRIADLVPDDERARRHYEHMQVAGPDARRAYGLPLRVKGETGEPETRYAVIRSVAVTAPIEALHADERHRLGVLFLLEPETDLALLTESLVATAQGDERRKLAGLLSHGMDTLVRVLAHLLAKGEAEHREFVEWLAGYVDRRVRVTAWVFDHWDAEPPLPPACAIEAGQARETLSALQRVFAVAAADPDLRSSLHWDNGALSGSTREALAVHLDWPSEVWFPLPVRGGFGLFLEEVLVNAVRHGRPGTTPRLGISYDPGRAELLFEAENEVPEQSHPLQGEAYGGRRILERLARLFGWEGLAFERKNGTFRASWRVPVSERADEASPD
jgi:PAS domain-containing protein